MAKTMYDGPIPTKYPPQEFKNVALNTIHEIIKRNRVENKPCILLSYYNFVKESALQSVYRVQIPHFCITKGRNKKYPFKILKCRRMYGYVPIIFNELMWYEDLMKKMYPKTNRGGENITIFDHYWFEMINKNYAMVISLECITLKPTIVLTCIESKDLTDVLNSCAV